MRYVTFALLFKYEQGLIVFNTISYIYCEYKSFHIRKCNNETDIFWVDTKSYIQSFPGGAGLNLAGLCWVSCHKFSDAVMMIFSGQSVISRVSVRIAWNLGWGGTKKILGTRYSAQWKLPQKWTVLNRTVPYHAVEKRQ